VSVKRTYTTADSGLTLIPRLPADGPWCKPTLSFVWSRLTAFVGYRHVIPLQTVW